MHFAPSNSTYIGVDPLAAQVLPELPVGNYSLGLNRDGQWVFTPIDAFTLPPKVYGNVNITADRIINTFLERPMQTGVMLDGEKGSGKTLISKQVSIKLAASHKVPTIVVNAPFQGDNFNTLVQSIRQPVIFLFDEFEKVYDESSGDQEKLLTLLDGSFSSKKLFLFTSNDAGYKVNDMFKNRPGRVYYFLTFKGLDMLAVEEYLKENLKNKDWVPEGCKVASMFRAFNFDMLKALAEESNRYSEAPMKCLDYLNVKPESESSTLNISLSKNGVEFPQYLLDLPSVNHNPYSSAPLSIRFREPVQGIERYKVDAELDKIVREKGIDPSDFGGSVSYMAENLLGNQKSRKLRSIDSEDKETETQEYTSRRLTLEFKDLKSQDYIRGKYVYVLGEYTVTLSLRKPEAYEYLV